MIATYMSHKGSVREDNQDRLQMGPYVIATDTQQPMRISLGEYPLLVSVIDGMGGYRGGAKAAQILAALLSDISRLLPDASAERDADLIEEALRKAAAMMRNEAFDDPQLKDMGATVAGLVLREKSVLAFNCGDCRAYRFTFGYLEKLTHDHSVVQRLCDEGEITEEEMRHHANKNIVLSAISAAEDETFSLYTKVLSRCDTDAFFLCSDGVWEMLEAKQLETFLSLESEEGSSNIADALFTAQCRDNISFIHLAP